MDSNEFKRWHSQHGQTLFCPGIPGAGKTILTSIVIDYLCKRYGDDPRTGIAYVYCNFRHQHVKKSEDLLANILKQLLQKQEFVPENIKALYRQRRQQSTHLSLEEISKSLQHVFRQLSRSFVIIDALDECQLSDRGRTRFLSHIFDLQKQGQINIFVTSRCIPKIEKEFEGSTKLIVRASDEDVHRYLDEKMPSLQGFVVGNLDLQQRIKTEITRAVDGMYVLFLIQMYII